MFYTHLKRDPRLQVPDRLLLEAKTNIHRNINDLFKLEEFIYFHWLIFSRVYGKTYTTLPGSVVKKKREETVSKST